MEIYPDFKELVALLNAHEVEYAIVGAFALAHYGVPRFTGDIDIFVKPETENARRILRALDEFGCGSLEFTIEDFMTPDHVVQLGVEPVRIDFMTTLDGVTWEETVAGRESGKLGDVAAFFIGRKQFILNKLALGRTKDLADLEAIGEK